MDKRLEVILSERYINNRNLLCLETEEECISTGYFGFGSLEKLYKSHINNYKKYRVNIFLNSLVGANKYNFYLSNIDRNILLKDKYIYFSYKELMFITDEFDFEIESISLESTEDKQVEIYIKLANSEDTQEILDLQKRRNSKIEQINDELAKLKALRDSI